MDGHKRDKIDNIVRVVTFVGVAALMVWPFIQYYHAAPDPKSLDGTYYNSCCLPVRIGEGRIRYGNAEAKLELRYERGWLHGYADRPFGPFYLVDVDGERKPTVLVFDAPNKFSVIDVSRKERSFTRQ